MIIDGKREIVWASFGDIRRRELKAIADRTRIGDKIKYKSTRDKPGEQTLRTGTVIGKYPHFALIKTSGYREAILWVDMVRTSQHADIINEDL